MTMIDMHCHILPGIDDGAQTVQDAMALLQAEKKQGIGKIVFTPHFYPERTSAEQFLAARADSFERLKAAEGFPELGLETRLGAEVFFSVRLLETDLKALCFEGTGYLLLELPINVRPYGLTHLIRNLMDLGITPILAHVERYDYFTQDPTKLYDLISLGCAAQVNAAAVLNSGSSKGVNALKYIEWELAQLICSDAHSVDTRPPNTLAAYELVQKKLGHSYADWLRNNSISVFQDQLLEMPEITKPRKFLGRWK